MLSIESMSILEKGDHFGYPACCVDHFFFKIISRSADPIRGPWTGSEFVPCPKCAPIAAKDFVEFVRLYITPNRTFNKPFPDDGYPNTYVMPKHKT